MSLSILYRGPLASCNYGCEYCPFAKKKDTSAELTADRAAWERFVAWCGGQTRQLGVFVTPWGEALTRRWYRDGLAALTHLPHVVRAAVQTNLSAPLDWLEDAQADKLGLWCTYHPAWTSRERFLQQCARLDAAGVRYSVGVVGLPEHLDDARALREALRPEVYLWVNAVKRLESDPAPWEAIDPLYRWNLHAYPSRGQACAAGERAITVDGAGDMRRCHFIAEVIGNLYQPGWERALVRRPCSNDSCRCHIGYVHLEYLELEKVYQAGLLERVPPAEEWRRGARRLPVVHSPAGS